MQYKCTRCNMVVATNNSLRHHSTVHSGEKQYAKGVKKTQHCSQEKKTNKCEQYSKAYT